MKQFILIITAFSLFGFVQAQSISKSQVPSVVLNKFKTQFPKATEVKWEMDGYLYRVGFEMRWNIDHEVWYNAYGETVKHKEELEKGKLPAAVVSRISTDFKGYKIEGAEKMTTDNKVFYEVELDAFLKQELKVTVDANGKMLSQEEN